MIDDQIINNDLNFWNERMVIADCLKDLGFNKLSKNVMISTKQGIIERYLALIIKKAKKCSNNDVLERLHFAGLIYGHGGL